MTPEFTLWRSPSQQRAVFKVRACENVLIGLTGYPEDEIIYEVLIGGNGNQISKVTDVSGGSPVVLDQSNTPNILNCSTFKTLWLAWDTGKIVI